MTTTTPCGLFKKRSSDSQPRKSKSNGNLQTMDTMGKGCCLHTSAMQLAPAQCTRRRVRC